MKNKKAGTKAGFFIGVTRLESHAQTCSNF
jgi:hypothetical protein